MSYYHLPIKAWAVEDRPREKLMQRGLDALTDAELIAILLGSGSRQESAIDLARKVLAESGDLRALSRSTVSELKKIKGIGPAKAISLVAAFELGRRKSHSNGQLLRVNSAESVATYLMPRLSDLQHEVFYVLFLNRNHEIKAEKKLFSGGLNATIIDTRMVFREAVQQLASAIIVAHNHPSGNLSPSEADIQITCKLAEAGKVFDIPVLDHIIVSHKGFYSFADEGMI